jgi:hypothetical protein
LTIAGGGCNYEQQYQDALVFGPAVHTTEAITYLDHTHGDVLFFLPGERELAKATVDLTEEGETVIWSKATRDGSELLVLTGPADDKQEHIEETLHRLPADGSDEGTDYEVRAPFNAVALSPDGTHAVLYFDSDLQDAPLTNANQVSIVNLNNSQSRNLTLNGFGGRLTDVQFPGQILEGQPTPVQVGDVARDIAAFLAQGEIVLVDMADATANQVAADLESESFTPVDTLLHAGDEQFGPALFARSPTSDQVAMLKLQPKPPEEGEEGFTVNPSLIAVGVGASDFVYHNEDEIPYLITANAQTSDLIFTDVRTLESFEIAAGGPISSLFLRDQAVGSNGTIRQLVAWAPGGTQIHTLDLDAVGATIGRTPDHLSVDTGIDQLVVLDNDRALIGSGSFLYVIDIAEKQVTPLAAQSPYDPTSSALEDNLLLLGTSGQSWISSVDLGSLNPESMLLDDSIVSFHYLERAGKVVVTHSDPFGHMTVADADGPSRSSAYVSWGYLLDGELDRSPTEEAGQ